MVGPLGYQASSSSSSLCALAFLIDSTASSNDFCMQIQTVFDRLQQLYIVGYIQGLMASFALLSTIYVTDSFLCFNRDQTTEIHYNRKLCCLTQNMKIGMLPVYLSYYNNANLTNIFNLRHAY